MNRYARSAIVSTRVALIVGLVLIWQALPMLGIADPLSIVPPSDAAKEALSLIASGTLLPDLLTTAVSVLVSFSIAAIGGLSVAILVWRRPTLNRLISPYLTTYYATPVIVFYPVLIAIFGLTILPVIILAAGWAIIAVILGTLAGLEGLPEVYHKVVRVYRLSTFQAMRRVYIPGAALLIFHGLRLASGYSISGVLAAEFLLSPEGGLGFFVSNAYLNFRTAEMYGSMIIVILFATLATTIIGAMEVKSIATRRQR